MRSIEATGKSVDAAIFSGLQQLGISIDEVTIDIIQMETKGILGIGAKPAKVRLTEKPPEEVVVPDFEAEREQRDRKERRDQRNHKYENRDINIDSRRGGSRDKSEDESAKRNERPRRHEKKKLYRNIDEMYAAQEAAEGTSVNNDIEYEQDVSIGEATMLNSSAKDVTFIAKSSIVDSDDTDDSTSFAQSISDVVREAEAMADALERAEFAKRRPRPNKRNKNNSRPEKRSSSSTPSHQEEQPKEKIPSEINYTVEDTVNNPAAEFVSGLIAHMGIEGKVLAANEEGATRLRVDSESMGVLIGHRGETLDAIQYLTSLVINRNRKTEGYTRVTINTEDYREKREETLIRLAKRVAQQVKSTGKARVLEPMNPYERRIMHATLQNNPHVATHSEGEEPNRRVIVTPKRRNRNYQNRRPSQNIKHEVARTEPVEQIMQASATTES